MKITIGPSDNLVFQAATDRGRTAKLTVGAESAASAGDIGPAYDQANAAREQANTAGNTVLVSANGNSTLTNKQLNFINTASVRVFVAPGQNGNANISFTTSGASPGDAYEQANAAYNQANSAYNAANNAQVTVYQNSASAVTTQKINFVNTATITVAVTNESGNANIAFTAVGGAAYDQANAAYSQANGAYAQANGAYGQANGAYGQANGAYAQANGSYAQANGAYAQANAAYDAANNRVLRAGDTMTGNLNVAAWLITQNIVPSLNNTFNLGSPEFKFKDVYIGGNTVYIGDAILSSEGTEVRTNTFNATVSFVSGGLNVLNQANSAYEEANSAGTIAVNAYGQANAARNQANAAYDEANLKLNLTGGTINGTLNISGNLFVSGNTSYINVATFIVDDSLLYLGANNTLSDVIDIGFVGAKNSGPITTHTGLARDAGDGTWYLFDGLPDAGHQNNVIDFANTTLATLRANINANNILLVGNTVATQANLTLAHDQANTARDQANTARTTANDAYGQANTARDTANASYGQANTARDTANAAYNQANTATTNATDAYNQANTARDVANASYGQANTARDQANTARTSANDAYGQANSAANTVRVSANSSSTLTKQLNFINTASIFVSVVDNLDGNANISFSTTGASAGDAYDQANNARNQANTARTTANDAYDQANTARNQANTARDQANTARTTANDSYGQANTARDQANTARNTANNAYDAANNRVLKSGDTMTGNLIMSGATINTSTANISTITTANTLTLTTVSGSNGNIVLSANGTEDMRIQANGFVTVGVVANPNSNLTVLGNIWATTGINAAGINATTANITTIYSGSIITTGSGGDITGVNTIYANAFTTTGGINVTAQAANAYDQANNARDQANTARNQANTARTTANDAYGQANTGSNTVRVYANSAGVLSNKFLNFINTSSIIVTLSDNLDGNANIAFAVTGAAAGDAYDQANTARDTANAAYNAANNAQVTVFANNGSSVTTQNVNFVNSATVTVSVTNASGNANIAFTSIGGDIERNYNTTTTSVETVDEWSATLYRSGKYQMQVENLAGFLALEIVLLHNGSTTNLIQYGSSTFGGSVGTFSSDISGGNVRLRFTATDATSALTYYRSLLSARANESLPTDLMTGDETYDLMQNLTFSPTDLMTP